jgi:hypothetical protein
VQDRPKDARISGSAFLNQAANFVAVKVQSYGRLQGGYLVNGGRGTFYSVIYACASLPFTSHNVLILNGILPDRQERRATNDQIDRLRGSGYCLNFGRSSEMEGQHYG